MITVSPLWEQTNRDVFTLPATVQLLMELTDQSMPEISTNRLISFNFNKSGDCLSSVLTQDTITFSFDNSDGAFNYNPENDVYQYAKVDVYCGYTDSINSRWTNNQCGTYYVSNTEASGNKTVFTAKKILGFMTGKFEFPVGASELVMTGEALAKETILQAQNSNGVPCKNIGLIFDSSLSEYNLKLLPTDNYSYAEILQLIANAFQCVLFVDESNFIHIEKLGNVSEDYVLSEKISYEYPKKKLAEKIGDIRLYTNHGNSQTAPTFEESGGELIITNPIVTNSYQSFLLANHTFSFLSVSRKKITGNFRADPRICLFDIIIIPNGKDVSVCAVTKINFTYNGGWRGTYEAVVIDTATIDMRICDIEMLKIKQIKSLRVGQLSPNTVSDDADEYIATKNNEIMLWEE